ncbi:hypothetical protein Bpfe_020518 [Biomphalaria pfeifferi]|uniref:Uncharacterized protein n=1 Tax=Biomphalaria pfeifferi TaxID=112525 RepID=A0AAD8F344_BIOPF|nr:hypothetical protein Bpfe_020518 [Biomphalaria pfeifferi]
MHSVSELYSQIYLAMELEKLHDYASILKDVLKSKTKTALEIFYNEQNCSELLHNEDYFRYTPPYTAKVEPALTFRGYIHKIEPSTLKLGLETIPFGEKDFNVLIRWTLAVHKKDTEEYEYLGYSQMNISSQLEVSEISVQSSVIQNLVQENCLLWKWNIEICPASIGLNKRKSRDALNVSMGHEVKIDKDFDEISKTLSSGVHRENKKMFTSILTSINECKNKQTRYDDRLQDVEQKVLDIIDRLSQILGKYSEKDYLLEELTKQTKLSTNMNPNKQGHAQITSIEEDPCTVGKYHFEKDYLLEESTILTTLLTHIVPENEMKLGLTKIMSVEEDLCTVGLEEEIASDMYNLNLLSLQDTTMYETVTSHKQKILFDKETQKETNNRMPFEPRYKNKAILSDYLDLGEDASCLARDLRDVLLEKTPTRRHEYSHSMTAKSPIVERFDKSPVKNILFIGSDAQMMRILLCSQFGKSQPCLITDNEELQEFQCSEEGIHFYCARISVSSSRSEILRLIESSEKYTDLDFHGCIIALSTNYDKCILDMFQASFLKNYCFLILSSELDKSSITQQVKEILPFDWFKFGHEILKNELQSFFGEHFQLDQRLLKQPLDTTLPEQIINKEVNVLREKLHEFTQFLNSIKYNHDIDSKIEPLTHQIISLLDQFKNTYIKTEHLPVITSDVICELS